MVLKQGNWVPYKLKPIYIERRLHLRAAAPKAKIESFLYHIITGDEKWIDYNNPKYKKL